MKKHLKKSLPLIVAFCLLTISYTQVVHQNHKKETTLIKIEQLKDYQLPDVTIVKKVLKFVAHLIPRH